VVDYAGLAEFLSNLGQANALRVVAMSSNGKRFYEELMRVERVEARNVYYVRNHEEAVRLAKGIRPAGDVVLFSPASASYGEYRMFERTDEVSREIALVRD